MKQRRIDMVIGVDYDSDIEKAKKVLERNPQLMAYFIYADKDGKYKVWSSPSMKGKIIDGK